MSRPAFPILQNEVAPIGVENVSPSAQAILDAAETARRYYIQTYGCQMNFYDSELVGSILLKLGYTPVNTPDEADLILLNTCAVRDHAEQRVFGRVGELKRLKRRNPEMILGVLGCMSQRIGDDILEKAPHVDLVVGPDGYQRLPEVLARIETGEGQQRVLDLNNVEDYSDVAEVRQPGGLRAWLAVQRGCNYACTYCIVPYVRGRERYRPIADVVKECERLVRTGSKEVTLIGQTVNAYRDGRDRFDVLPRACNEVAGLDRIRYTTSHPLKMRTEIFEAMAECDKVVEFLHLPFQSGSDRILQHMRRGYTADEYKKKIRKARSVVPGLAVATDVIVGYPTETEDEFKETLDVVRELEFDMVYPFKFSVRPGTPAAEFEDDIAEEVKQNRLLRLIEVSKECASRCNEAFIGTTQEVLVEGRTERDPRLTGRTRTNKPVHFEGQDEMINELVQVKITDSGTHSLMGDVIRDV